MQRWEMIFLFPEIAAQKLSMLLRFTTESVD